MLKVEQLDDLIAKLQAVQDALHPVIKNYADLDQAWKEIGYAKHRLESEVANALYRAHRGASHKAG